MTLKAGDKAPDFSVLDHDDKKVSLKDFKGRWLVLYFYPKDDTPGCTVEAIDFTAKLSAFEKLGATIVGVSADTPECHRDFIEKQKLAVRLLSDPDKRMLQPYGVWQKKQMAGREYMGIERTTLLIDPAGRIARTWNSVKVKGHADEVLAVLQELAK